MTVPQRRSSDHDHDHDHDHHMVHDHRAVQDGSVRAAIFGVSDGLVSNVALILGVAAASSEGSAVLIAGVSGLLAGAASMAAGEYVSMKAQNELIERELRIERESLANNPALEVRELSAIYRKRGLDKDQARDLAEAVHQDPEVALEVHAREELGVDPDDIGDPVGAAVSSFIAFAIGAILPLVPWFFGEGNAAMITSVVIGLVAAALVGLTLARFTERSPARTALRQVSWAAGACIITFVIGSILGTTI
jgi:VIT1/CCC1 family predicted Fe2+/Mn2+ transporter